VQQDEPVPIEEQGATQDWAEVLHRMNPGEGEVTMAIDMEWLTLHLDFEEVEVTLREKLKLLIDEAVHVLTDDVEWERYEIYLKERQQECVNTGH
jgi:hypothetical protein